MKKVMTFKEWNEEMWFSRRGGFILSMAWYVFGWVGGHFISLYGLFGLLVAWGVVYWLGFLSERKFTDPQKKTKNPKAIKRPKEE